MLGSRKVGKHVFTVDVEDWYQGIPIDGQLEASAQRRLDHGLSRILDLLAEHGIRGTFFVLGPVAQENPQLVRRIAEGGHELGCHGWSHQLIYAMTPYQFREETRRAVDVITDLTGNAVEVYRAPYFSITRRSLWALEILADLGFHYDSSIYPVHNWRYGIPDWDPGLQRIDTPAGAIWELPISIRRVFGYNFPVSGGAYFRLYPYAVTHANFLAVERDGRPVVFYLHPWELDPEHPRIPFHWKAHFAHYANLRSTEPKLRRLLREFRFGALGEVIGDEVHGPRA